MRHPAMNSSGREGGLSRGSSGAALVMLLVLGLVLSAALSLFNPALGIVGMLILTLVLAGLREPLWAAAVLLASLAIIPVEFSQNFVFGHSIENPLQIMVPLTLLVCLVGALKDRSLSRPIVPDLLIVGLGIWGMLSLYNAGQLPFDSYWNKYGNKLLFPMGFYYVMRLLPLDNRGAIQLIRAAAALVVLQSVLIFFEARGGGSPIYGELHQGRVTGPFGYFWTAAAFLAMWPPLLIFVTSKAKSRLGWALGFIGVLLVAYAVTRTGQRGATFLLLITVPLCLFAPSMRKVAGAVIVTGMILYVPWSMSGSGSALLSRFDETDESRAAYRTVAWEMIKSDKWNPLFGVGPYVSPREMKDIDVSTEAEFFMHGRRTRDLADIAESGHALHNVYMTLLVEFGAVGAFMAALAGLFLIHSALKIYLTPGADKALLFGALGALAAWGGIGYLHNIYSFAAPMCMFFFFYALIVGQHRAFFPHGVDEEAMQDMRRGRRSPNWRGPYLKAMRASRLPRSS